MVDPIDWIELVPFDETRNYVQRVIENLHVYRHRMAEDRGCLYARERSAPMSTDLLPQISDIEAAERRLVGYSRVTPLLESSPFKCAGRRSLINQARMPAKYRLF